MKKHIGKIGRQNRYYPLSSSSPLLADAPQEKTEQRLDNLAKRVDELAEAQKKTEIEVKKLAKGLRETRQMVGGLSDTVGYGLEDRAIAALPQLLQDKYNIKLTRPLTRQYILLNGRKQEINMFGSGEKDGHTWWIVGEGKARLAKKHINAFEKLLTSLKRSGIIKDPVLPLMVSYTIRPEVA